MFGRGLGRRAFRCRWSGRGSGLEIVRRGWFVCALKYSSLMVWVDGLSVGSLSEEVELGEVVCEYAVAAPDAGAVVVAKPGASPAEIAFQIGDASFAAGAPFHRGDESIGSFDGDASCGWFPGAGYRDGGDAGGPKIGFHGRVPVAAISGEHAGRGAVVLDDAIDGGE